MELIEKIFLSSIVNKATTFRNDLRTALIRNDFEAETYEHIGRENTVDKGYGGQDECLLMIKNCNALVGIIDLDPGTNYLGEELYKHRNLLPDVIPEKLTVTMAEILYARYVLKIPTIVLTMPGVMVQIHNEHRLEVIKKFVDFLNQHPNNYLERDIFSLDEAINKINGIGWCPVNRMKLLGNALSGPNWNGVDYFDDREITIRNALHPTLDALRQLTRNECKFDKRVLRLKWLINHLNKFAQHKLDAQEMEFLEEYVYSYTGLYPAVTDQRDQVRDENKANNLLMRLPFGDDAVFGSYGYSRKGLIPAKLGWPSDGLKWTAQGRIEFILYALQMENMPPKRLNAIADFNASHDTINDRGFLAHYSRKPVTIGCQNAADVRLAVNNGSRGIAVRTEMKSMLYLAFTGTRYCLIGVHVNGDSNVDEEKVLAYFTEAYNTSITNLGLVDYGFLTKYLDKIDSPLPEFRPEKIAHLSKCGAQEIISLFASSINPVSIFMSVRYKYEYILTKSLSSGFDCLMLWDNELLKQKEVYNNAGSPTWGMRFNPSQMYNHIFRNTAALENEFEDKGLKIKYKMASGAFSKPKKII